MQSEKQDFARGSKLALRRKFAVIGVSVISQLVEGKRVLEGQGLDRKKKGDSWYVEGELIV